ncbi:MAG TPA: FtsX-like permease family protein [Acidimicrobiales bacterium]|nr:FtsX-like permease family protein [Acidimicrobiales bacterium]
MGRILLVFRLAARNLRRRPAEAALLLLAITAATTVLTLGLVLRGVTNDPYQNTREATAGPDVVASFAADPATGQPADLAGIEALTDAPGVIGHSGPYPVIGAELEADGVTGSRRTPRGEVIGGAAGAWAVGRDPAAASVDQPELTQGSWVRDGGVVVEAGFADALDVGEGDQITLRSRLCTFDTPTGPPDCGVVNGRSFRVVGVAVTAAARPYPDVCFAPECPWFAEAMEDEVPEGPPPDEPAADESVDDERFLETPVEPGLVWLTKADARGLAPAEELLSYVVNLKLADPTDAPAFVNAHHASTTGPGRQAQILEPWQDIREDHDQLVKDTAEVLQIGSRLLAVLALASVAVLVGGRMADQTRRVGLLKAVGGTPRLVAAVLLTEYLILALLAAAAGLAAGWLAAPVLTDPGAGLLGRAGAPSLTLATVGQVTAVALGVAAIATVVPAVRAAWTGTVPALADAARPPRRTPWLIAISARLPVPLLLGLRVAARRPRRVLLSVASIAVTVSGIVAVLAARAQADQDARLVGGTDPGTVRLNQVLLVITITLVALAAVNAIFVTWATALDAKHSSALARALGATPQQVSTGLSMAQVLPALVGAALGIAGGLALFAATGGGEDGVTGPPLWQLLAVVPVTVLVVAALTTIPARLGARRPAAEILQAELA